MLLIGNCVLVTLNPDEPIIHNGTVLIDGEKIGDVGKLPELNAKYPGCKFYDAKGKIVMPGFMNTHMHIYSALARGMNIKNAPVSKNFNDILENLWWRLDKALTMEDVQYSALVTYMDCVKNGVTTVFDHHASPNCAEGSLFTIAEAAKTVGIRTSLCYEVSDRDGERILNNSIKENVDFIKYTQKQNSNMLSSMFGLHASMTLSEKTLEKCVAAMGDLDAGFHIHVAEGISDLRDSLKKYGKRVVTRLSDAGLLGKKTLAVHCVHINKAEIEILKESGAYVIHNPQSNMGNAVGCAAIMPLIENGVTVGLGTDGYTSDMLESFKTANILHKHHLCDPSVSWAEPPLMLFENNRKIVETFFKGSAGVIKKGANADMIIMDYMPPTPINESNIYGHVHFGMTGRNVVSTMINGNFVYKDREFLTVNEQETFAKARECAERMWGRING